MAGPVPARLPGCRSPACLHRRCTRLPLPPARPPAPAVSTPDAEGWGIFRPEDPAKLLPGLKYPPVVWVAMVRPPRGGWMCELGPAAAARAPGVQPQRRILGLAAAARPVAARGLCPLNPPPPPPSPAGQRHLGQRPGAPQRRAPQVQRRAQRLAQGARGLSCLPGCLRGGAGTRAAQARPPWPPSGARAQHFATSTCPRPGLPCPQAPVRQVTPTFFSDRAEGVTPDQSAAIVGALQRLRPDRKSVV